MGRIPRNAKIPNKPADWVAPWQAHPQQRNQIFLPDFTIALIHTPFLSPRFASFQVPLSFNKLDLRDYLRRAYGVHAIRVRSFVQQQKVTRAKRFGKPGYGPLRRPMSTKKMTVEMTEPFVWPEVPEDMSPWEQEQFNKAHEYQRERQQAQRPDNITKPDEQAREAFDNAAKEVREEKKTWRPTWQALGLNYDRASLWKNGKKDSTGSSS
ncbi:hypothetical protein PHISP_00639 [Aspergillus sp. HF37]|nr:hypothetical protein PHISP_00639 [Aspergillus sp. HF37]